MLRSATIYKLRNRVESCFNELKHFRRSVATWFDRLVRHYLAFISIAASMIWMLMNVDAT